MFSYELCEIFKNTYFGNYLQTADILVLIKKLFYVYKKLRINVLFPNTSLERDL